jgi:hypothetical protein
MKRVLVVLLVLAAMLVGSTVYAESIGIIPTLTKADEPRVAETAAAPGDLPEQKPLTVIGLEMMSWFGPDSAAALGVSC